MKILIVSIILGFLLSGCASTLGYNFSAGSEDSVKKGITYDYDEFQKHGWLSTELYLSDGGSSYNHVTYKYRALYENNKISFIQIYGRMGSNSWCFLDKAFDRMGNEYKFIRIDREVVSGGIIFEHFGLEISKNKLESLAKSNLSFKAIGSKCDANFTVDKLISSAFLNSVNSRI
jgi:uncharacterized protein YceK